MDHSYFGRIAARDNIAWDISNDDGPGMDDCSCPDLDASKNGDISADIHVFSNVDIGCNRSAPTALHAFKVVGHLSRVDGHVGTHFGVPPNRYSPRVEKLALSSNGNPVTNGDVVSVVTHEGRVHKDLGAEMSSHWGIWAAILVDPSGC